VPLADPPTMGPGDIEHRYRSAPPDMCGLTIFVLSAIPGATERRYGRGLLAAIACCRALAFAGRSSMQRMDTQVSAAIVVHDIGPQTPSKQTLAEPFQESAAFEGRTTSERPL
jgi:hypothetical protein